MVPAQAKEITIPAEITPERVPTTIVDFSFRVGDKKSLFDEISNAGVICLVYDVSEEETFDKLSTFWLPLIREALSSKETNTPIILVGNKLDMITQHNMESMISLMNQNNEIETCIDCSAKNLINLTEMFWFAQKAVLYPTAPLYISEKKELTPKCISALSRIFRISDTDNDGYLSDKELGAFQEKCFAIPLPSQSLHDVKKLIRDSCPGGTTINGVSLKGFLYLHLSLIMNSRQETTWTVLRQFGYDNQLKLSKDFLNPVLSIPPGCSTEISPIGHIFLRNIFKKFDMDQDSCLREFELQNLFSTCSSQTVESVIKNIGKCVETNAKGWVTRQGFIAYWELMAYFRVKMALEYFAYLGFTYQSSIVDVLATETSSGLRLDMDEPLANRMYNMGQSTSPNITTVAEVAAKNLLRSIHVTGEKRIDIIKRHTNRKVFYCRVYGAKDVGKTCFLQGLLHRSIKGLDGLAIGGLSNDAQGWAAASGVSVYGQPRTLLMQEISESNGELMSDSEALEADVACFIYDSTDKNSFKYVANIFLNYYNCTSVPCIFIAGKADQPSVPQNYHVDPFEFTAKYNLPDPEPFTSLDINMQTSNLLYNNANRIGSNSGNSAGRRSASSRRSNSSNRQPSSIMLNDDSAILRTTARNQEAGDDTLGPLESATSTFKGSSRYTANQNMTSYYPTIEEPVLAQVHPVYAKIATMANYPHLKGLQLAPADYGWKLGIAATILAGFGFVAFRMAKGGI